LQREAAGPPTADHGDSFLVLRVAIGLDQRFRGDAGDEIPADEAMVRLLPDQELGLLDFVEPGVTTHRGVPFESSVTSLVQASGNERGSGAGVARAIRAAV
jgi:hypothetical protein